MQLTQRPKHKDGSFWCSLRALRQMKTELNSTKQIFQICFANVFCFYVQNHVQNKSKRV